MWQLAWRNLWRNRTRTIITGTAVALTLALRLCSVGTAAATYDKMLDGAVQATGGSVLVHGEGYWRDRASDQLVPDADATMAAIAGVDGVEATVPRVLITGLISSARGNTGVLVSGIVPAEEAKQKDWSKSLMKEGGGTFLGPEHDHPIVLGKALVEELDLKLGKKVILTASDNSGEATRFRFVLGGIVDTGSEMIDKAIAYTRIESAREAMGLKDEVTQIGVLIANDDERHQARDAVKAALGARAEGLEILSWDDAMPEMLSFIRMDKEQNDIFNVVIFLVVAFGIANTFLMSVLERVRELGLLAALGLTPKRVAQLVLSEAVLLAAVFIAVGVGLGYAGHYYMATVGIDITQLSSVDFEISGVVLDDFMIHSKLNPLDWIRDVSLVLILIVASAAYPAWRATRLEPATAMRTYE